MPTLANLVGYTGAVVGTFLMLPQVIKSWRTKRVEDLSMGTVVLYFVNCLIWLTYGVLIAAPPVFIANGIGLGIGVIQLIVKMKYREKGESCAN